MRDADAHGHAPTGNRLKRAARDLCCGWRWSEYPRSTEMAVLFLTVGLLAYLLAYVIPRTGYHMSHRIHELDRVTSIALSVVPILAGVGIAGAIALHWLTRDRR